MDLDVTLKRCKRCERKFFVYGLRSKDCVVKLLNISLYGMIYRF